jgi:hypothetical protein
VIETTSQHTGDTTVTSTDTARTLRAIDRLTAEVAEVDARLALLADSCPDAATVEAHPEVIWQRDRRASLVARVAVLRAEFAR